MVECCVVSNAEPETCRTAIRVKRDCEARGGTLVLLEDATYLSVYRRGIELFLRARNTDG